MEDSNINWYWRGMDMFGHYWTHCDEKTLLWCFKMWHWISWRRGKKKSKPYGFDFDCQQVYYAQQWIGIQSCMVLLTLPQWPPHPVWTAFVAAKLPLEQFLGHMLKAWLLISVQELRIVVLDVEKIRKVLVEAHSWEVGLKGLLKILEGEAQDGRTLLTHNSC